MSKLSKNIPQGATHLMTGTFLKVVKETADVFYFNGEWKGCPFSIAEVEANGIEIGTTQFCAEVFQDLAEKAGVELSYAMRLVFAGIRATEGNEAELTDSTFLISQINDYASDKGVSFQTALKMLAMIEQDQGI